MWLIQQDGGVHTTSPQATKTSCAMGRVCYLVAKCRKGGHCPASCTSDNGIENVDSMEMLKITTENTIDSTGLPVSQNGGWTGYVDRFIRKAKSFGILFLITVAIPLTVSILYFGVFASDTFISESRFVVVSPEKPAVSGLGVLLKGAGFSSGGQEVYAVQDFVTSRDAMQRLNKGGYIEKAYGMPSVSIFDRFGTFITGRKFEDLYRFYVGKVAISHDSSSSITTLSVRAFTARDARRINEQLLEMAEATVNRLNERGRKDLIKFAATEVEDAKAKARDAALALSSYRNRAGVVDPEKQASLQLQMISKIQDELIASRTQLQQLRAFAPQNSQVSVLTGRIKELESEIQAEQGKVAGDSKSLSSAAAQYQRLALESQFADKQLATVMASLEEAQNEARRKQAYVERIVQPNLPDKPLEPRRLRAIFATLALGLIAWGVLNLLIAGVKEHVE